jgi:DNA modification methylase
MAPEMFRTLKPNGFLVFFYGMSWHNEVHQAFIDAGFAVDYAPVIWDRSDGRTFTTRPDHFFTRGYDVALYARKGDAKIVQQGKPNILRIPPVENSDKEALVERPVELYAELIQRLTIKGERVADFFVGSGSCPAAAASLGRDFFGCELSSERRALALKKIAAYTPESK